MESEKKRFQDLFYLQSCRSPTLPLSFEFTLLADFLCLDPVAAHLRLSKMLDVKDSPSICLCLSPAFFAFCPSPTLFRISLCIFHLLVVTLSNDSIYFRKQCPIYSELGNGKKKQKTSVILSPISIFLSVIISNIQRRMEKTI